MNIPINNKQDWRFLYHDETDSAGVPLSVRKEEGKTVLKAYEGQIRIELIKYDRDSKRITAKYQIFDPARPDNLISGDIIFKIDSQDEKKWIGFPTKFNGLCAWTIWPLSSQSEEKSSHPHKGSLSLQSRIKKQFFGSTS